MLELTCEVIIKGNKTWVFNKPSRCRILEDVDMLTDTCEIDIPGTTRWEGIHSEKVPIKKGDRVIVKLGYDHDLKVRFAGFIREVHINTSMYDDSIQIECENEMLKLKRAVAMQKGFKETTLEELVSFLLQGTSIHYKLMGSNVNIGRYSITKSTIAEELNELKVQTGIRVYFRYYNKPVLYIGYTYPKNDRNKELFVYGKNIISERLTYELAEDIKVKVKATSKSKDGTEITTELGDETGYTVPISVYGIDKSALDHVAERVLKKYKYTGHRGSIETFGEPMVNKCDIIQLEASDSQKGLYMVKKVEVSFGSSGYRQEIELGPVMKS